MYKYNYVLFNNPDDKLKINHDGYYTICAKDLDNTEQTRVVTHPLDTKPLWIRLIFLIHNSGKIAKFINLPLKRLWYPLYFQNNFTKKCQKKCKVFSSKSY